MKKKHILLYENPISLFSLIMLPLFDPKPYFFYTIYSVIIRNFSKMNMIVFSFVSPLLS